MIKLLEYLRRSKLLFNLSLSLAGLCISIAKNATCSKPNVKTLQTGKDTNTPR